ncbi:MAG: PKD domain-containing protein [Bacteroidota bacterium]
MKFYPRLAFTLLLILSVFAVPVFGQTISITSNFDTAIPYSPGSTMAVPFHVDNSTGSCITQTNTFNLYLSNSSGVYSTTPLATVSGFYATFINATIPAGTASGTGYKVKITASSNLAATIVESAPFTIATGSVITAGIVEPGVTPLATGIFGKCDKTSATYTFDFQNTSTAGTTGSVVFNNEINATQSTINTLDGEFIAQQTNYTIIVKATNGSVYGTKAYTLINNSISNNLGSSTNTSGCLATSGSSVAISYTIDTAPLLNNFPGTTYRVNWGDGSSASTYTLCDIINAGNTISHIFTRSSCGNNAGAGNNNVFKVDIQPVSSYCSLIGTQSSSYASISLSPSNKILGPAAACSGVVKFINASYPGEDPASTPGSCIDFAGAKYNWYLDGSTTPVLTGVSLSTSYSPTLSHGPHRITLRLTNNQTSCGAADAIFDFCVQDPPKPKFTLPVTSTCTGSPVTPTDQTVLDAICPGTNTYTWTVTGPTAVTYAGGTNANSTQPQFSFTASGTYQIKLAVSTPNCGSVETATQQIAVNALPATTMSNAVALCGPQVLNFSPTGGTTQTTFSGTPVTLPTTYTWAVTGGAYSFTNGTTTNSQYPQITLTDFAVYTVSVTHQNSCGTVTKSQQITIQQAPTVSAGSDNTICATNSYQLTGSITGNTASVILPVTWTKIGGDGSFDDIHSLTPVYTLGTNDKANGGIIKFTMTVNTTLAAPCNKIQPVVNLTITPVDRVTSVSVKTICSGTALNYAVTASNSGSTFTWTAAGTIDISGYQSQNTPVANPTITDLLTNANNNTSGTVTYTITPYSNGCPGTPFTYTVTVNPTPILAPIADASICSGKPTNIVLNAIPIGTKFIWTVTGPAGTGGYGQQGTATTGPIIQTLTNSTNAQVTITYTITPVSASGCPGTSVTAKVFVSPTATQANAGLDDAICNQNFYTLKGNPPLVGTGKWTLTSTQGGVNFDDETQYNTTARGLVSGQVYTFRWTISSGCDPAVPYDEVIITDNAASAGGTALAANGTNKLTVCNGDISGNTLTLTGKVGNVIRWEKTTDGTNWSTIAGTNSGTTYTFSNLTQSTSFRAVVLSGSCLSDNSTQVDVTVNPATAQADAGLPQTLCNQTGTILNGNQPSGTTGKWTLSSGQTGVTFDNDTKANAIVSGLVGGQTYTFTWTLSGLSPCGPTNKDVIITNQAPISGNTVSIQNNTTTVCAGSIVKLLGNQPSGGGAFYAYTWEKSTDNGQSWAFIAGETSADLTIQIVSKTSFRRTVNSGSCSNTSTPVTVDISAPVSNNTLAISAQTCYNTVPGFINATKPNGGDGVNFIYQWQISSNATTGFVDIPGATQQEYQPTQVLIADKYYRRVVSTTFCSGAAGNISTPIHIIVNPDVVAKFTANTTVGCAPFNLTSSNITATPDPNVNTYTWLAITSGGAVSTIGTGLTFPGYPIPTDGTTITIKLVVSSNFPGCPSASYSLDFSTPKAVIASFNATNVTPVTATPGSGCSGPLTYSFTNTSTPLNGAVYTWIFGDNSPNYTGINPPNHTFQPDATGNDAVYQVKLIATVGNCSVTTATKTITVYPAAPKAFIDPGASTGCAPYTITVKNITPGTNSSYVFRLYDETNTLKQVILKSNNDKSDAVFAPVSTANTVVYTVNMTTTNLCGVTTQSVSDQVIITSAGISARMGISPLTNTGIAAGCAPFMATFLNQSTGGTGYVYNIYDSNFVIIKSVPATGNLSYSFDTPGTYYVSIGVFSSCGGGVESAKTKVTVYPVAAPAFVAIGATTACTSLTVGFSNKTPDLPGAPAAAFTYTWDYGDGSPTVTGFTPPPHTYDYKKSPYTVTLSVVNNNGCFSSTTQTALITVNPPPQTDFTAQPDTVIAIPNYSFAFVDKSKVTPASWKWDFGDKATSTRQNPSHTYADTGKYVVTLITTTAFGCTDSKTHTVRITGVPGQLYVPNAFMPTSLSQELRVFTIKGSGLRQYHLRIINNWGQTVFETSKLSSKGEPSEFWDGRFKGQDAPQGVYAWEITASFINGTEWGGMSFKGGAPKRAGTLTLIK